MCSSPSALPTPSLMSPRACSSLPSFCCSLPIGSSHVGHTTECAHRGGRFETPARNSRGVGLQSSCLSAHAEIRLCASRIGRLTPLPERDVDSYDLQGSARTKSASDTTAAIGRLELRSQKARVLARPDPATISPQTSLRDALAQ